LTVLGHRRESRKSPKKVRKQRKKGVFHPFFGVFEAFSGFLDRFHEGSLMKTRKKRCFATKMAQNVEEKVGKQVFSPVFPAFQSVLRH